MATLALSCSGRHVLVHIFCTASALATADIFLHVYILHHVHFCIVSQTYPSMHTFSITLSTVALFHGHIHTCIHILACIYLGGGSHYVCTYLGLCRPGLHGLTNIFMHTYITALSLSNRHIFAHIQHCIIRRHNLAYYHIVSQAYSCTHTFRTMLSTQVTIALFCRHELALLTKLIGPYTIAFWTQISQT